MISRIWLTVIIIILPLISLLAIHYEFIKDTTSCNCFSNVSENAICECPLDVNKFAIIGTMFAVIFIILISISAVERDRRARI